MAMGMPDVYGNCLTKMGLSIRLAGIAMQPHSFTYLIHHREQIKADAAVVGALLSFCLSVAAFWVSVANRRRDRIKNTMTYLDEWRDPDFTADRDFITKEISKRLSLSFVQGGYRDLSAEDSKRIRHVSHYLEYLGTMIRNKYLDENLILEQIGEPVERLWMILGHLIQAERLAKARGVDLSAMKDGGRDHHSQRYQQGFEHIAALSRKYRLGKDQRMERYTGPLAPLSEGSAVAAAENNEI